MNFGSKECFDYLYNKIKDDDYILDFYYELAQLRVVVKVTSRRYPEVTTEVYIKKDQWEDKFHLNHILTNFKNNYVEAFKSLKEATNDFQV